MSGIRLHDTLTGETRPVKGILSMALQAVTEGRDGIVVQPIPGGDDFGFNDDNEQPDRQAAEAGVLLLKELFDGMAAMRRG